MIRTTIHASICVLVVAVGLAVTNRTIGSLEHLNWMMILTSIVGGAGMLACAFYCFRLRGTTGRFPWLLFVFPGACVAIAGVSVLGTSTWYIDMAREAIAAAEPSLRDATRNAQVWTVLVEQQLSFMWAEFHFFGIVLAASCWGPGVQATRAKVPFRSTVTFWSLIAIGVLAAVVMIQILKLQNVVSSAGFDRVGFSYFLNHWKGHLLIMVGLLCLVASAGSRLRPYLGSEAEEPLRQQATPVIGAMAASMVAACVLVGHSLMTRYAAQTLAESTGMTSDEFFVMFPDSPYFALRSILILYPISALILAVVFLYPARQLSHAWLNPVLIAGLVSLSSVAICFSGADRYLSSLGYETANACGNGKQLSQLMRRADLSLPKKPTGHNDTGIVFHACPDGDDDRHLRHPPGRRAGF